MRRSECVLEDHPLSAAATNKTNAQLAVMMSTVPLMHKCFRDARWMSEAAYT